MVKKSQTRGNKIMVAAWITTDAFYAIKELLLKLSRDRGSKVTMQEALTEALVDYSAKHRGR